MPLVHRSLGCIFYCNIHAVIGDVSRAARLNVWRYPELTWKLSDMGVLEPAQVLVPVSDWTLKGATTIQIYSLMPSNIFRGQPFWQCGAYSQKGGERDSSGCTRKFPECKTKSIKSVGP